jgi:hypothetical protein
MQHQLVLQFRRSSLEGLEIIAALEGALATALGATVAMDGHDVGKRFINVFVLSADPASSFRRAKPSLESLQLLEKVTAAHRVVGGSLFKVIWPLRVRRKFALD